MLAFILKNSGLLLLTSLFTRGCLFVINLLSIKFLDTNTYGQFVMIRTTAVSIEGVISGALGSLTIKEISKNREKPPIWEILIVNIFLLCVCLMLILLFSEWLMAKLKFEGTNFEGVIYIVLILIPTKLYTSFQNIYMGLEDYKRLLILSMLPLLVTMPICYTLISSCGLVGVFYSLSIFYLLDSIVKFLSLIRNKKVKSKVSKKQINNLFFGSNRYLIATLTSTFSFWYMRTILAESSNGLNAVANFDVSYQFLTIIMILTGSTTSVLLPMLTKERANKTKVFSYSVMLNVLIIAICAVFVLTFSSELLGLFKSEYVTDTNVKLLKIMMFVSLFFTLSSLVNKVVVSIGSHDIVMYTTIFSSLCMLASSYIWAVDSALNLGLSFITYYFVSTVCYSVYLYFYKIRAKYSI